MNVYYDGQLDILRIRLRDDAIEESEEVQQGLIVDYDHEGQVIGFEILHASKHVTKPNIMEFSAAF
jgi:uncharacterized protein YuzE